MGVAESQTRLSDFHFHFPLKQRTRGLDGITDSVFEQTSGDGKGQGSLAAAVHGVCRVRHTRQQQPIKYSEASGPRPVLGGGCSDKGSGLGLEKPIKETFPPARRWALEAAGSQPAQGPVLPWALLCARPRLSR